MGVRVLDYVGAFAGAVADEETWTLLEVFGEAGFVDYGWGGFCCLDVSAVFICEYCGIDFHAAGVYHWDDVAEIPGQARDDIRSARDDIRSSMGDIRSARDDISGLSDKRIQCTYSQQRLARSEAEAFGGRYSYAEACV